MKIKCIKHCSVTGVNSLYYEFKKNNEYECGKIKDIYFLVFDVSGVSDYVADNGILLSEYFDVDTFDRKLKLDKINEKR